MTMKMYRLKQLLKQAVPLSLLVFLSLSVHGQYEKADTLRHAIGEADSAIFNSNTPTEVVEDDVDESSSDSVTEASSIDEKKYFDEIGSTSIESLTDKYQSRKIPNEAIQNAKSDPAFWYANADIKPEKKDEPEKESFLFSRAFGRIVWITAIVGFIIFLVIYLSNSNIKLFRRSANIETEEEVEPETDDIFNINYQREIDRAMANLNFRLATRLMFLRLLRTLSEKQIIEYTQDRTNLDYLMQLRSSQWYNDFFRVTRDYEYSWYGQFSLDKDKFNLIRKDFEEFEKKLR